METIIQMETINKYNLHDELFSCPVCSKKIKAIFLNDHYTVCKLDKLKVIQEKSLKIKREMQQKNQDVYYELLLKHYKDSLKNFTNTNIINNKLEIVKSLFNEKILICLGEIENNIVKEKFDKIFYYSQKELKNINDEKFYIINFNNHINMKNNENKILHINFDNYNTSQIKDYYSEVIPDKLLYYSNYGLFQFISKIFNLESNSILVFILSLIDYPIKITVCTNDNILSNEEKLLFDYLKKYEYILEYCVK